jgi:predicted dehydrogenase/threonine dehydrogenase-like Zn-dependent dehydrogenase
MKQAIVKRGMVVTDTIPAPAVTEGSVIIQVYYSAISAGTELSAMIKSKDTMLTKVFKNNIPRKIIDQITSDGISTVYKKVKQKIGKEKETQEQGKPVGYSLSGIVIDVGAGVSKHRVGDRVAAAGAGYANHAEYVNVPENLVMRCPEKLDLKYASTVTLGGIALQGVRRADLKIGEYGVVYGAGILGLLTVQLLRLAGIRVITIDLDDRRLNIAKDFGAELTINARDEDPVNAVNIYTGGLGSDAVLFTASTSQSEPLSQSFQICKKKGRVIMVGVSGMDIRRQDMYTKELDLLLSTAYGPGRYDRRYEEKGLDYPYAYVRWTENRNMEEYLRLLQTGEIQLDNMIDNCYKFEEIDTAFTALNSEDNKPLIVLLDYGVEEKVNESRGQYELYERKIQYKGLSIDQDIVNVGILGVGNFASSVHIPNIIKLRDKYKLYAVASPTGLRSKYIAEKYEVSYVTTNYEDIINDNAINLVMICTQHKNHADLVLKSLKAGKHTFVEKPLAINQSELDAIRSFFHNTDAINVPLLMVGFNRRFSPYSKMIKRVIRNRKNPLHIRYRMNAGNLPLDHWVYEQGGRIIGEACHIIDLMTYFTEAKVEEVYVDSIRPNTATILPDDNKTITLRYEDGSLCSLDYVSIGNTNLSKEYMEIHFDGKSIVMDDYNFIKGYGISINDIKQPISPKGHLAELEVLYEHLRDTKRGLPIPLSDMLQTTQISFMLT